MADGNHHSIVDHQIAVHVLVQFRYHLSTNRATQRSPASLVEVNDLPTLMMLFHSKLEKPFHNQWWDTSLLRAIAGVFAYEIHEPASGFR